jgi:hypothetical protein
MPSIQTAGRLTKKLALVNLVMPEGLALSGMLVGPHGIGKSQVVKQAARQLGGHALVVEGGSLGEGEITGLPFASKTADGSSEVRFVPYFHVATIQRLEKKYYEIARTTGFLNGRLMLTDDGLVLDGKVIESKSFVDEIIEGEENKYGFGSTLPLEVKLELLESGEIKPVLLFIDELNRADSQVMKELMNIILTKIVSGYHFPWWLNIVSAINPSSQNSTYATNEMDDAQNDRFVKIKVDAKIDEWIDYALDAGLDPRAISSIATAEDIFMFRDKSQHDIDEQKPTPRSWEMVIRMTEALERVSDSKFFTAEDKKSFKEDLRALIAAKVGPTAARTYLLNYDNIENHIKPIELINGKSDTLDEKVVAKFKNQKQIHQKIVMENVITHISKTVVDFENKKKSTKPEEKKQYLNYKAQIKEFVEILDDATKLAFAKKMAQLDKVIASDGKHVFGKIYDCFAKDILASLMEFETGLKDIISQQ